ncbi:MAG: hypothetical protein OSJ69_15395 [Acetatifactor sp.]|nr:hypothetical protein [Acetatifactor sp.]
MMKKMCTAILLFDLLAGLLFLGLGELESYRSREAGSGRIQVSEEESEDIRKIAITFDDEVIIGLSQEICCIEAISLI